MSTKSPWLQVSTCMCAMKCATSRCPCQAANRPCTKHCGCDPDKCTNNHENAAAESLDGNVRGVEGGGGCPGPDPDVPCVQDSQGEMDIEAAENTQRRARNSNTTKGRGGAGGGSSRQRQQRASAKGSDEESGEEDKSFEFKGEAVCFEESDGTFTGHVDKTKGTGKRQTWLCKLNGRLGKWVNRDELTEVMAASVISSKSTEATQAGKRPVSAQASMVNTPSKVSNR